MSHRKLSRRGLALAGLLSPLLLGSWTPVTAQTPDDSLVTEARQAARSDRNRESAALFGRAIAADPSLAVPLRLEYADQLTYSDRAAEAIPLFRQALEAATDAGEVRRARRGLALALSWADELGPALREYEALLAEDPRDMEALLGRARVLAWSDRLGESIRQYEAVLAFDPGHAEARREIARVESWRGRHRRAESLLESYIAAYPMDAEALYIRSQVHWWQGEVDEANATLRQLFAARPGHERGVELEREIRLARLPAARVELQSSSQSDRLGISTLSITQTATLRGGRTLLGIGVQRTDYRPDEGPLAVSVYRPGVMLRHRLGNWSEINANLYREEIVTEDGIAEYGTVTFDSWLTLWPDEYLRIDLSANRATFDNPRSLIRQVTATFTGASGDFRLAETTVLVGRGNYGRYSDGNSRIWLQSELSQRVWNQPRITTGARGTLMRFSEQADNGYFAPESFRSLSGFLHATGSAEGSFHYDIDGSLGMEWVSPGETKPIRSASARVAYELSDRLEIGARYNEFS